MFKIVKKNVRPRIMRIIGQITEDYDFECSDNYRFYEVGDEVGKREYLEIKSTGCCGFVDDMEIKYRGKSYIVGFNYGH